MAEYEIIDQDVDGVTDISLKSLEKYINKTLRYVVLSPGLPPSTLFVFKDHTAYQASGLSYGYSGEGPHGLHKAIKMFSNKIAPEFENTVISKLHKNKLWYWYPTTGFIHK